MRLLIFAWISRAMNCASDLHSGAQVQVQVTVEAEGELDANLVDLSVKESVVQLDGRGKVVVDGL